MKTYITVKNQSIIGLAVQLYGNVDAVPELLRLNDLTGKMDQGLLSGEEVDLGYSLLQGTEILYDETSPLRNQQALTAMAGRVLVDGWQRKGIFAKTFAKTFN